MVVDSGYGTVSLAACEAHRRTAQASGEFVMEHEYTGLCGFPSTLWNEEANVCVLDDSGEEPDVIPPPGRWGMHIQWADEAPQSGAQISAPDEPDTTPIKIKE